MASDNKYSAFRKLILKKFFNINVDENAIELYNLMALLTDAQEENCELTDSISVREKQIEELSHELDATRRNLASVQNEKQRVEEHRDRLQFNLKQANSSIDKLQEEQKKLQKQVEDNKSKIREIDTSLSRKTEKLDNCFVTIDTLKNSLADSELHLREAISKSENKQQEATQLQAHNAELEDQIKELEKTIKQRDAEIAEAKYNLDSYQADSAKKDKQIEGLKGDIERLQKLKEQLTSENAKLEGKSGRLSKAAIDLKKTLEDSQQEVDGLKIERKALNEELEECKRRIDQLQQELKEPSIKSDLEAQIAKLVEQVESLRQSVESRDHKIEEFEARHEVLGTRLKDVIRQHEECQHLLSEANKAKKELESRLVELQDVANSKPEGDDEEDLSGEIKELVSLLADREYTIQQLNEQLSDLHLTLQESEGKLSIQEKRFSNDIEKLNHLLREKDDTISQQAKRIKELESVLAAFRKRELDRHVDSPKVSARPNIVPSPPTKPAYQLQIDFSEPENRDLPILMEGNVVETDRSIKSVINLQTGEHINANEFFGHSKEEIATMSRKLEIIAKSADMPLLVCEKCLQPVRISKITYAKGESLFFSHCHRDVPCEWRTQNESTAKPVVILGDVEITSAIEKKSRYSHLKKLIYDTLIEQLERGYEVSDVDIDKRIKGESSRVWRQFDVYVKWHNIDIVFKLQRSSDYLQDLVGLDEFCKQKKIYIIWVFGSDSAYSYDYLLKINYQNTLFDNRSCVFIMDSEAETACREKNELTLKCNWLIDDKHWRHTFAKTGFNGVLVTLNDLNFDNTVTYKPYYRGMEASSSIDYDELLELKSGIYKYRKAALWGIYNNEKDIKSECKYSDISLDEDGRIVAVTDDYLHPRKGYLSDSGEQIPTIKEEIASGVYVLNVFEQLCLADEESQPLTQIFESIEQWADDRLIVETENGFGVIDYHGNIIVKPKYLELEAITNLKAKVTDYEGTYYINIYGDIIPDETIDLPDGFQKVRHLNKWGIYAPDGTKIVDYKYNEIASFRRRFYGVTEYGVIKIARGYRCSYRSPFKAKYNGSSTENYTFDCHGVKMIMPINNFNRAERVIGQEYEVFILNIHKEDEQEVYTIAAVNQTMLSSPFDHIDMNDYFKVGVKLTGKVIKIKNNKRLYIRFPNGRQTYISKARIHRFGFNPNKYVVNSLITLQKLDFDPYYEVTKWKVIK